MSQWITLFESALECQRKNMKVSGKDGITIIRVGGRLDDLVASELKDLVREIASRPDPKLLIDMAGTVFVDSSGCLALLVSQKAVRANRGDLKILRPSRQAMNVFQLTELDKVLEIHDSIESAVDSFSQG